VGLRAAVVPFHTPAVVFAFRLILRPRSARPDFVRREGAMEGVSSTPPGPSAWGLSSRSLVMLAMIRWLRPLIWPRSMLFTAAA
jgi:hypothetical protein